MKFVTTVDPPGGQVSDMGCVQLEELQAHRFGPHIIINVTIGIDGALTVSEGHLIACCVENVLSREFHNGNRMGGVCISGYSKDTWKDRTKINHSPVIYKKEAG